MSPRTARRRVRVQHHELETRPAQEVRTGQPGLPGPDHHHIRLAHTPNNADHRPPHPGPGEGHIGGSGHEADTKTTFGGTARLFGITAINAAVPVPRELEMLRRTKIMVVAAAIAVAGITPVAAASAATTSAANQAAAAAPYCGITWGSLQKSANPTTSPQLTNIRAGRHACYDRLVFDVRGKVTGYWVRYVPRMTEDPSGRLIPLRGGAKLSIAAQAPAYNLAGQPTYRPANRRELVNVSGYRTFRQVAFAGSFEGVTTVGLGTRARLPFRAFTLPGRLVVDVAHRW